MGEIPKNAQKDGKHMQIYLCMPVKGGLIQNNAPEDGDKGEDAAEHRVDAVEARVDHVVRAQGHLAEFDAEDLHLCRWWIGSVWFFGGGIRGGWFFLGGAVGRMVD